MIRKRRRDNQRPRRPLPGWILWFYLSIFGAAFRRVRAWWIGADVMRDVLTVPLRLDAGGGAEGKFTLEYPVQGFCAVSVYPSRFQEAGNVCLSMTRPRASGLKPWTTFRSQRLPNFPRG